MRAYMDTFESPQTFSNLYLTLCGFQSEHFTQHPYKDAFMYHKIISNINKLKPTKCNDVI